MKPQNAVLIVEDSPSVALLLTKALEEGGFESQVLTTGDAFNTWLAARTPVGAVLLDIMLPDADGIDLLRALQAERPETPTIMMTGHATVESAVECMKAGAYDFLTKPVDVTRLLIALDHALERRQLQIKVTELEAERQRRSGFGMMIGQSTAMQGLYTVIQNVAPSKAAVLVSGETGVGKELVAQTIHNMSDRAHEPFVAVNCGALPRELIESELFGHEKGAFTGADRRTVGKCAQANRGTLFLDEVGEIPLDLQVKFLRFLQNQEVQRIGSEQVETVDVRVVAATNREPLEEVREGRMREDLFYRLNVVPVVVPPLRDRVEDIPSLAEAFLREFSRAYGKSFDGLSDDAVAVLMAQDWPGNVRELRNVIERLVVMNDGGVVTAAELPSEMLPNNEVATVVAPVEASARAQTALAATDIKPLAQLEREAIESAYDLCEGNVSVMAERLEMSVSTMYRKLKEYGLPAGRTK